MNSCRECGVEVKDGEGVLLYVDPVTGDKDYVCSYSCNMAHAGLDDCDMERNNYYSDSECLDRGVSRYE
tara:strand:- start:3131 stop:3337 length:207 start_codon:yes stop_codon:yes gene_type:complete